MVETDPLGESHLVETYPLGETRIVETNPLGEAHMVEKYSYHSIWMFYDVRMKIWTEPYRTDLDLKSDQFGRNRLTLDGTC